MTGITRPGTPPEPDPTTPPQPGGTTPPEPAGSTTPEPAGSTTPAPAGTTPPEPAGSTTPEPAGTPPPEPAGTTAPEPAGTAEALLRTAQRLFAHQGYDATSVRQITAEAGANLGAVTYHFGSKQELYHAVLRETLAPLAERVIAAAQAPGAPLDRAGEVVRAYFDVLGRHPDVPFLLIQEMMAQREAPAPLTNTLRAISGSLAAMIVEGQQDGTIRPGDPLLLALSIVAQPVQMSVVAKVLAQVAGVDTRDTATRERVQAHSVAFVCAGLRGEDAR